MNVQNKQCSALFILLQDLLYHVTRGYEKSSIVYIEASSDKSPLTIQIVRQKWKCMPNRIRERAIFVQSREVPGIWISFTA